MSFLTFDTKAGGQRGQEDSGENPKISAHTVAAGGLALLGVHCKRTGRRDGDLGGTETLMIAFRISICFKDFT